MVGNREIYHKLKKNRDLLLKEIDRIKDELNDVRRGMIGLSISSVIALITRLIIGLSVIFSIIAMTILELMFWYYYKRVLKKYRELILMDPDDLLPLICVIGTIICLILSIILP